METDGWMDHGDEVRVEEENVVQLRELAHGRVLVMTHDDHDDHHDHHES